jgi:hypothetical protein
VPLGYDSIDKKLVVNGAEAEIVQTLFGLYLQYASVRRVKEEADRMGLRTKMRKPNNSVRGGGERFTRGHIYKLLSNPIYVGEIAHKGERFSGLHEPIIDRETWIAVQEQLKRNAVNRRSGTNASNPSLLAGMLIDEDGNRMSPSHASKAGRRYRYYVSRPAAEKTPDADTGWRLPASAIEEVVLDGVCALLRDGLRLTDALNLTGTSMKGRLAHASRLGNRLFNASPAEQRTFLLDVAKRIEVGHHCVGIVLRTQSLHTLVCHGGPDVEEAETGKQDNEEFRIDLPVAFRRRGAEMKLVITDDRERSPTPDPRLIAAVAQGCRWFAEIRGGNARSVTYLAKKHAKDRTDIGRAIPFAFLAPDIVEAILNGRQPTELTAARLKRVRNLPVSWAEQRHLLGFMPRAPKTV